MALQELIDELTDLQEDLGDIEVRLAFQPEYPLQYQIGDIQATYGDGAVVYLAQGDQPYHEPYLPESACETLGWND